jgi:hypothetical protein
VTHITASHVEVGSDAEATPAGLRDAMYHPASGGSLKLRNGHGLTRGRWAAVSALDQATGGPLYTRGTGCRTAGGGGGGVVGGETSIRVGRLHGIRSEPVKRPVA